MHRLLTPDEFFAFLNKVLVDSGRGELPPENQGPHRRIITIEDTDRVLQILAGPGSGKTEMLVWRVLFDLCVCGTPSESVIVTTFTRRAATELNVRLVERCDQLLHHSHRAGVSLQDPQIHNLRVDTIHSLCDTLLSEHDDTYMEAGTQLIDEVECVARLARHMGFALGYSPPGNPPRLVNRLLECRKLVSLFRPPWDTTAGWPSRMMTRVELVQALLNQQVETWYPRCAPSNIPNGIEILYGPPNLSQELELLRQRWEEYLSSNQILDYATIQKRFLDSQAVLLPHIRHVLVDEFQDTNPIQFAIHTGWLQCPNIRLTVVGDDDQALYRFRGSDLACFTNLEPSCVDLGIFYRRERLEENHRSTRAIVCFSQAFKSSSVLAQTSMRKEVRPGPAAAEGTPVRLLRGPWQAICGVVADELDQLGCGRISDAGSPAPPSAAILMFSTSEISEASAARALRQALEESDIRAYNPRNKTAAAKGSPVFELLGLISYLIDPVTKAPAGRNGRPVEVAASMNDGYKAGFARTQAPPHRINEGHLRFQKGFLKENGGAIGAPAADRADLFAYIDRIRNELARFSMGGHQDPSTPKPRLTLAGLVARLLSFPRYRGSGFTERLFRQALFTTLLEAHTAPTRRTRDPLDAPLEVELNQEGEYVWPERYWNFLNVFGAYLDNSTLDDIEVEAFEENAVLLLTFHQAKGLEFDHVYVCGTGRSPDVSPVLRTKVFSGETPAYQLDPVEQLLCSDPEVVQLATADREREVYVALTRAKTRLTVLYDPGNEWAYLALNPVLRQLFEGRLGQSHPHSQVVEVVEYTQ